MIRLMEQKGPIALFQRRALLLGEGRKSKGGGCLDTVITADDFVHFRLQFLHLYGG